MILAEQPNFIAQREHRFIKVHLHGPHRVLSTSSILGGEQQNLTAILNNQSCEGSGKHTRANQLMSLSRQELHNETCMAAGLDPLLTAMLGTAANMDYAGVSTATYSDAGLTVISTAGVDGNAGCSGDPAQWHEGEQGYIPVHATPGTINIIVLFHQSLSQAALARSIVTLTEAKSHALAALAIPSRYSKHLATGTGTDQYAVACPLAENPRFHWTGNHAKLGEILGSAVYDSVREALRWQNGHEASRTRHLFHALLRYGVSESAFKAELENLNLEANEKAFLLDSLTMISHDPRTSASAYAMAAILDRQMYQVLPEASCQEALRWQAALLACSIGGNPNAIGVILQQLPELNRNSLCNLVANAIVLGWRLKWN